MQSGSIPACGRYPGEGTSNSLQYYCLENSMKRGAWWAIVQDWVINTLPGRKINHKEEGIMSAFKQIVELGFEKGKSGSMKVAWFGRKINGDHIFRTKLKIHFSKDFFFVISESKKQAGYKKCCNCQDIWVVYNKWGRTFEVHIFKRHIYFVSTKKTFFKKLLFWKALSNPCTIFFSPIKTKGNKET